MNSTVPHMEPLIASDLAEAVEEARELIRLHASAVAAHIFLDEERLATIAADRAATAGTPPAGRPSVDDGPFA